MRRDLALLVAALAALAWGCSSREHLNPLDPANIATRGAPQGFTAVAADGQVLLSWSYLSGQPFGLRLTRSIGGAPAESLADLPSGVASYQDNGLTNGVTYTYSIAYELENGALGPSADDVATPGHVRPWVADYGAHAIYRLTPDGRRVAETIPDRLQTPLTIDIGPGRIWVCDPTAGVLWRISSQIAIEEWNMFVEPVAAAVDRTRHRVWVCDQTLGALKSLDTENPTSPYADVRGLATPLDVAVDVADGSAWVCERTGDRVRHISGIGGAIGSAVAVAPSRVAVDSLTRRIWVSSFSARRVTVFSSAGTPVDTLTGLAGPVGVAIDARAGRIWVCDPSADRVVAFDRNGQQLFHVDGLTDPVDLTVDLPSGEAWVVLPAGGRVVRIAPDGRVLRQIGGFSHPNDVAVEP